MKVPISGRPLPEVEWMRGGDVMVESDRVSFIHDEHSVSLHVSDCGREDAGEYMVKVHNYLGKDQTLFDVAVAGRMVEYLLLGNSFFISQ